MDSLSNLVELNLSYNSQVFSGRTSVTDLWGTFNQSLKRLSLRHCQLSPRELHLIVSTFCWTEAIDLSENPELLCDLSPLLHLQNLKELVVENMYDAEEGITFDGWGFADFLRAVQDEDVGDVSGGKVNCDVIVRHGKRPLECVNLSGNKLDDATVTALSHCNFLKVLVLVGCQLQSEGLINLLGNNSEPNIRRRCYWKELHLDSNNIGDLGAQALADKLKAQDLSSLQVLNLQSNTISVNALKIMVEEGLAYSTRLVSLSLLNDGAVTSRQQESWHKLEQTMNHYLLLNRAGRDVLYVDKLDGDQTGRGMRYKYHETIPSSVWPLILEEADRIYGTNALYYFLHQRPDLILAAEHPQNFRWIRMEN
jgi:hypothetical protein